MKKTISQLTLSFLLTWTLAVAAKAQADGPVSCGPLPTENQLRWQDMEMYAFREK